MDVVDAELEEGEISDNSDCGLDLYTPLERPAEPRVPDHHAAMLPGLSPDEEESEDSDSDDGRPCGKKLRMSAPSVQIPKKYCVWSCNDTIADMLTSFGMEKPENDRNVENYPIPKEKLRKDEEKRMKLEARRRKIPIGRKCNPLAPVPVPKELDDVNVDETNTLEEVAKQIAEKLEEPNLELVQRIVLILGKETAIEYFKKTREIESKGGLLIMNGSRRRTSGGVFIYLIRSNKQIPGSKLVEIFEDPNIVKLKKEQARLDRSRLRKRKNRPKIQKQLSNPPPSPEVPSEGDATPEVPSLPELPNRKDLLTIRDLRLPEPSRELLSYEGMDFPDFP